jgi:hypothetical protein
MLTKNIVSFRSTSNDAPQILRIKPKTGHFFYSREPSATIRGLSRAVIRRIFYASWNGVDENTKVDTTDQVEGF